MNGMLNRHDEMGVSDSCLYSIPVVLLRRFEMKNVLRIVLVCWLLVLAGVMTNSVYAQGVTIALGSEPTTLDPQIREDGGERAVNDNVYETLMARTPQGDLEPGLADHR